MLGAGHGSSDSLRGRRNFVFLSVTWITHDFTNFPSDNFYEFCTQQRRSVSRCKLSKQNFENFFIMGRFSKITQKCLENVPTLATSGRRNSAMITDRRKLAAKINLYGMSSFHFYCWNQFKVISLACTLRTAERTYPQKFRCWWSDADYTLCDIVIITRWCHELYTYSK